MPDETSRAPSRYSAGFYCPRCGVYSQQEWNGLVVESDDGDGNSRFEPLVTEVIAPAQDYDIWDQAESLDPWDQPIATTPQWRTAGSWVVSKCLACQHGTVWHDNQIVFPAARTAPQPSPDMPQIPRELYQEAALVMQVSRRAGAAMARATLERLLIDLDPMDTPRPPALDERIIHVTARVSSALEPALTVIRHAGNKALHVADAPDDTLVLVLDEEDEGIVELLFSAINDLVDELVTKPNARQRLLNTVPASVIEAIERKKAAADAKKQAD